jgi:tetratricopeptide (TPR) repeat protein
VRPVYCPLTLKMQGEIKSVRTQSAIVFLCTGRIAGPMLRIIEAVVTIAVSLSLVQGQSSKPSVAPIESLIRSHEYDQALQMTKAGLHEAPNDFRLWTLQGIIFSLKRNDADARTAFEKALGLSPNYEPALKGEVQLLYQSGDKRAIPLLERILNVDPSDQTAHEMLAMLERKLGDCRAAIDHFVSSADAIRTHAESLEAYGYCLVHVEEFEKAVPVFERLVELLPARTYPRYDLAIVLTATKQSEAAIKILEPLLTEDQKDPDVLSLAAQAYEAVGDTPKSVVLLRQAIVLSPATASYYVLFAAICLDHDSFQVGIDMTNAGLQRMPQESSLYLSRGLLYAQLAQYDKAEADFNKVERLDSAQGLASYAVDLTEVQKNNPDEALRRVRSQLKIHPDSALLHSLLAELITNQAPDVLSPEYKEAMKSALLAVKLKPELVGARDVLASMYMRSGQYNLAIEQCRLVLKYSPSDESAAYHLVVALRHSGQGNSDEMKALVKRLSVMHQESLKKETDRKRYRLIEQEPPPSK